MSHQPERIRSIVGRYRGEALPSSALVSESLKNYLQIHLQEWYALNRRRLPWRGDFEEFTSSAYGTWVSEIMLQQTRVETVIEYWKRWMRAFPDVPTLASTSPEEVNKLWAGLGYYRRAQSLLNGSRMVVERFEGEIPNNTADLLTIPGVGPYTAGAIASIAFNKQEALVDGNVMRVFSRLFALTLEIGGGAMEKQCWDIARALVPAEAPGTFNQALMELGATVCQPTSPSCGTCPVSAVCQARRLVNVKRHYEAAIQQDKSLGGCSITTTTLPSKTSSMLSSGIGKTKKAETKMKSTGNVLKAPQQQQQSLFAAFGFQNSSKKEESSSSSSKQANTISSLDTGATTSASNSTYTITDCVSFTSGTACFDLVDIEDLCSGEGKLDCFDDLPGDVTDFPHKKAKKLPKEVLVSVCVLRRRKPSIAPVGSVNAHASDKVKEEVRLSPLAQYQNQEQEQQQQEGEGQGEGEDEGEFQFLFVRRPPTGLLAGQWEFPSIVLSKRDPNLPASAVQLGKKMESGSNETAFSSTTGAKSKGATSKSKKAMAVARKISNQVDSSETNSISAITITSGKEMEVVDLASDDDCRKGDDMRYQAEATQAVVFFKDDESNPVHIPLTATITVPLTLPVRDAAVQCQLEEGELWSPFPKYLQEQLRINYRRSDESAEDQNAAATGNISVSGSRIKTDSIVSEYSEPHSSNASFEMVLQELAGSLRVAAPVLHVFSHERHTMHVMVKDVIVLSSSNASSSKFDSMKENDTAVQYSWMSQDEILAAGITTGCKKILLLEQLKQNISRRKCNKNKKLSCSPISAVQLETVSQPVVKQEGGKRNAFELLARGGISKKPKSEGKKS
jgi:A/G-specific adenine glycosylase